MSIVRELKIRYRTATLCIQGLNRWATNISAESVKLLLPYFLNEFVNRNGRKGHDLNRSPRPEFDRHASYYIIIRRFDEVYEIVLAENRVLSDDAGTHVLDLPVDFLDPFRIVLDGLPALVRKRAYQNV